jgi:peptidyl-prolyl cis-trans isomerase SurA
MVLIALFSFSGWVKPHSTYAQEGTLVDQVVAVVGKHIILESDLENQYLQLRMQGEVQGSKGSNKCRLLEESLFQKLLLNQAEIDSVEVTDSQIDQEMDHRLRYFIAQIGSQEAFEEYCGKTIPEFKAEFRDEVKRMLMIGEVQRGLDADIDITPSEVREYYKSIPRDSLPLVNSEVTIGQIVKIPPVSLEQKLSVKEKLRDLRKRVLQGENFSTMAILYSEDPGSASKGGELGLYGRGELYPEFEAIAYKLEPGEVSEIVETPAGFHIIQLIERKGEYVNARHILMRPKVAPEDMITARNELDSVAGLIRSGETTFDEAVLEYSDDPGKHNRGLLINFATGTTKFEVNELEPNVSFVIDKLDVGEVSGPVAMQTEDGEDAFRLLYLKSRTLPHRANLEEDYNKIQFWALQEKKAEAYKFWAQRKVKKTYVKIIDMYRNSCTFDIDWLPQN